MRNFIFASELFLIISITSAAFDQYRIVETKYGQIRGFKGTSLLEKVEFYSFLGVPYAKAPVDVRRFKVSHSFVLSVTSIRLLLLFFKLVLRLLKRPSHGLRK